MVEDNIVSNYLTNEFMVVGIRTGVKPVINFKVHSYAYACAWSASQNFCFIYAFDVTQGYMVGNGVCDPRFDSDDALVPFAHGMGLISDHMYKVGIIEISFVCISEIGKNKNRT